MQDQHIVYGNEGRSYIEPLGTGRTRIETAFGGSVAEWFWALVLLSGGPGLNASTKPLKRHLFLGSPKFSSSARFVNSQPVCFLPGWEF